MVLERSPIRAERIRGSSPLGENGCDPSATLKGAEPIVSWSEVAAGDLESFPSDKGAPTDARSSLSQRIGQEIIVVSLARSSVPTSPQTLTPPAFAVSNET
jgi:hypothetical protein